MEHQSVRTAISGQKSFDFTSAADLTHERNMKNMRMKTENSCEDVSAFSPLKKVNDEEKRKMISRLRSMPSQSFNMEGISKKGRQTNMNKGNSVSDVEVNRAEDNTTGLKKR